MTYLCKVIQTKLALNQGSSQKRTSKFLKDIGIYAIGNLGSKIITFCMVPLYTHFIENSSDYGYYDICLTAVFLIMPFVTMQLRDGAFRFLLETEDKLQRVHIVSMVYRTLALTFALTIAIALTIACFFKIDYLGYTIALLLAMSLQEVVSQVFRGLGDNKAFISVGILSAFGIGVFSVIFVVWADLGIKGIFIANILARIIAIALVELKVRTIKRFFNIKVPIKDTAKNVLSFSLPLLSGSLCWWLTSSSDRWFILEFLGRDVNGIYAVSIRFTSILTTFATIFYQAWQETAILQYNSPDRDSFFSKMLSNYIVLLAIMVVGFCFVLKVNYFWLIGNQYSYSKWYLYPMAISALLFAVSAFFDMGYQCAKDTARTLPAITLSAVINVVSNYVLVRIWCVWGVIATSIITYTVLVIYRWFDMRRYILFTLKKETFAPLIIMLIAGVAYYLTTFWWQDMLVAFIAISLQLWFMPKAIFHSISNRFFNKTKCNAQ